ncbi:hypothetical protein H8356DRAFT_1360937 [Neocallimastix lanati (nom. inval.)]|nr:hypothetical protein H8356DRAFT_1360937 [Neocallimastix sp. JGI-2020a]
MIILLFEEDRCKEYKHEYWIFVNINENGSNPYGHLVDMGKKKKLNKYLKGVYENIIIKDLVTLVLKAENVPLLFNKLVQSSIISDAIPTNHVISSFSLAQQGKWLSFLHQLLIIFFERHYGNVKISNQKNMDIISMIHLNNGTNEWEDSGYASISQSKNTSYKECNWRGGSSHIPSMSTFEPDKKYTSQKFLILPSNFNMKSIKSSTKKIDMIPTNSSLFTIGGTADTKTDELKLNLSLKVLMKNGELKIMKWFDIISNIKTIGHTLSCGIWNFQNELLFITEPILHLCGFLISKSKCYTYIDFLKSPFMPIVFQQLLKLKSQIITKYASPQIRYILKMKEFKRLKECRRLTQVNFKNFFAGIDTLKGKINLFKATDYCGYSSNKDYHNGFSVISFCDSISFKNLIIEKHITLNHKLYEKNDKVNPYFYDNSEYLDLQTDIKFEISSKIDLFL